jgi:hypothetical protein
MKIYERMRNKPKGRTILVGINYGELLLLHFKVYSRCSSIFNLLSIFNGGWNMDEGYD